MPPDSSPLALICSVAFECEQLRAALSGSTEVEVGRKSGWEGRLDGAPVLLLPGGMGKANAAQALTAVLETRRVRGVVGFGIGGAYPASGLEVGDVTLASSVVYGDEGVRTPDGWISSEGIGIPLLEGRGERRFNEFPLDPERVERARAALAASGLGARVGPFVTVSCCSGTTALGREMGDRFRALCEGMEGAALAHVAALYDAPFLEVRGISNHVEDRDLSAWRIGDAAAAAQRAVRVVAAAW